MGFTHAAPGGVKTQLARELPFYARLPYLTSRFHLTYSVQYLVMPFLSSISDCADFMTYNFLRPDRKTGAYFVNSIGEDTSKCQYFGNEDVRTKLWKHSVERTGLVEK